MDSSRELALIYAIGFIISLYLILLIGVQTSDLTATKVPRSKRGPLVGNCFNVVQITEIDSA